MKLDKEGYFKTNFGTEFPKIQIITVADLLDGESPNVPQYESYYKITEKYEIRNKKLQTKLDDRLPNNK